MLGGQSLTSTSSGPSVNGAPNACRGKFCHKCTPARVGKPGSERRRGWVHDDASLVSIGYIGTIGARHNSRRLVRGNLRATLTTTRM